MRRVPSALRPGLRRAAVLVAVTLFVGTAIGQVEPIVVIGVTPLTGTGIDIDRIPGVVATVDAADLLQDGAASLTGALANRLGSINVTDTLADALQPDILYRGFVASPVLGVPQGLAVYLNGVRINEAFGDTVNWDLVPDLAVARIDVVSANPSYGLNALGGAVSIRMKDGFSYTGREAQVYGGAFAQRAGEAQFGANDGTRGFYAAAKVLNQDGWRYNARDSVRQWYGVASRRAGPLSLDLAFTHVDNQLHGQGAAPVQELAVDRQLSFTGPQLNRNQLEFLSLNTDFKASATASLQGAAYLRDYTQHVANGNGTQYLACGGPDGSGKLCQADGLTPLVDAAGMALPDLSAGGTVPIGENDLESIHTIGSGFSIQFSDAARRGGHANQFTAGVAIDTAHIDFAAAAQPGIIGPSLQVQSSGLTVSTSELAPFPATPTWLRAVNSAYGAYFTDTLDLTARASLTASGRYNVARVDLFDQRGTLLSGANRYAHFNPSLGATYRVSDGLTGYADSAVTNRAPTASEIECSDPSKPCVLPASLAGDPPTLRQVIARTLEAGLRGRRVVGAGKLTWNAGVFRADVSDDIYAVATSIASGYFRNIAATRRAGAEFGVQWRGAAGSGYLQYSLIRATFEARFSEYSPNNPAHDLNGDVLVVPGDRLPGIAEQRLKLGADYRLTPRWSLGGELVSVGSSFFNGDEANRLAPLAGYRVASLHVAYRPAQTFEAFASVRNVFNTAYDTAGILGDPTGAGAPGIPLPGTGVPVDHRFVSPAAPRALFLGARLAF